MGAKYEQLDGEESDDEAGFQFVGEGVPGKGGGKGDLASSGSVNQRMDANATSAAGEQVLKTKQEAKVQRDAKIQELSDEDKKKIQMIQHTKEKNTMTENMIEKF